MLEYEDDPRTFRLEDEFLVGDDLLAAPVVEEGARGRKVYFPGGRWLDWRSERIHQGPADEWIDAPLEVLPLFIREGAIVPTWPVMNHVGEKPVDRVTLEIFVGAAGAVVAAARDTLYEDDGSTTAYERGVYRRTPVEVRREAGTMVVSFGEPAGGYSPPPRRFAIRIHDQDAPREVRLDGRALDRREDANPDGWDYIIRERLLEIAVRDPRGPFEIIASP